MQPWVTLWTPSPFWAAVNHIHKSICCHRTGLHLPSRPCHFPVWFPAVLWLQGGWVGGVRVGGSLAQLSLLPAKTVFQYAHIYRCNSTDRTSGMRDFIALSPTVSNSPRTSHEKHTAAAEGGSISRSLAFILWDKDSGASGDLHFSAAQVITWPNNRRRSGSPFPRWMEMQPRF